MQLRRVESVFLSSYCPSSCRVQTLCGQTVVCLRCRAPVDLITWQLRCSEAYKCAAVPTTGVTSLLPGSGDISSAAWDRSLGSSGRPAAVLERRQNGKAAPGICHFPLVSESSFCKHFIGTGQWSMNVTGRGFLNEIMYWQCGRVCLEAAYRMVITATRGYHKSFRGHYSDIEKNENKLNTIMWLKASHCVL